MPLNFNKSLVLPWSNELSQKEPYEYPFLATYNNENKFLHYVAALHSIDEESETFKLIEQTIKKNSIDFIIVEGIPNSRGESPLSFIDWAKKQGENGKYQGFETAFTIKTSASLNISFIGGEPKEIYIYNELLNHEFKTEDYIFYTFTQQIFQAKEAKILDTLSIEKEFKDHIDSKVSLLDLDVNYSLSDFHEWFELNNLKEFSIGGLIPETCAPYVSGNLLTQRVSSAICILRDQYTISVIEEAFKENNNVMIVYGGSHWSTQKQSIENTLGIPEFKKL